MKKLLTLTFILIALISCEENSTLNEHEQNNSPLNDETLKKEKIENYKKLGLVILKTAENNESFKELVYQECLKEKYGDYFIKITDLIDLNLENLFWDLNEVVEIETYINNLKNFTSHEPVLFIPFVENLDEPITLNSSSTSSSDLSGDDTKVVFKDEYNVQNHTCPGYTLNDENLIYEGDVDEDYAWENDIWVIGDSEFGAPELIAEDPSFDGGSPPANQPFPRTEGRAEYGGLIQVTDLNEIESWISGKLEMRIIVVNSSGTIIKNKEFPKRKRSRFTNNKWYDYDEFIANWNTPNIGNYMIEGWIEVDGGGTTTVTQSFPAPPDCTGCPSTTFTYNLGSWDEDLGKSIVQFSDNVGQVYGISHANFKRK